jgi:hypothetical protein
MVRGDAWFSGHKDARWHADPLHKLSNIHVPARPATGNSPHRHPWTVGTLFARGEVVRAGNGTQRRLMNTRTEPLFDHV